MNKKKTYDTSGKEKNVNQAKIRNELPLITNFKKIWEETLDPNKLYFLPLAGCNEIGMNLNLYIYKGKILIVDVGVSFDNSEIGAEVLMPNIDFLIQNKDRILGIIITHAHEDHYGGMPFFWHELRCPVYLSPFTEWLLTEKTKDRQKSLLFQTTIDTRLVRSGETVHLDPFSVTFFPITHSIPENHAMYITTDKGIIFHSGDWKLDPNPCVGEQTCLDELKRLSANSTILAVIGDSTNVFEEEHSGSEGDVIAPLESYLQKFHDRRIALSCFASNVARLKTCANLARKYGRIPMISGRSLQRFDQGARTMGLLEGCHPFEESTGCDLLPPEKVFLVMTGSQGQDNAALAKLCFGELPDIHFEAGDVIIFSARIIPGNEKLIHNLQNQFIVQGLEVITTQDNAHIHVSGHPSQVELRQLYDIINPYAIIPVHGEPRHIWKHYDLARSWGYASIKSFNGMIVDLSTPGEPMIIGRIKTSRVFLDGNLLLGVDTECALDRKLIAKEGCVSVVVDTESENFRCEVAVVGISNTLEDGSSLQKGIINTIKKYFQGKKKDADSLEDAEDEVVAEKKDDQTMIDELSEAIEKKIWGIAKKRPLLTIQFWGRALAIVRITPEVVEGEAEALEGEYDNAARSERRPYTPREGGRSSSFGGGDRGNSGFARREGGDRPRSFSPRSGGSSFGGARRPSFGGPRREGGDRGDRPRSFAPRREGGEDRPARSFTPRDGEDRAPRRDFGDRAPRAPREGGEDRPARSFAPREGGDRGDRAPRRDFGDRAPREGGDRPRSFGPRREDGDRPRSFGPRREGGDRGDRAPRRDFGDRAPREDRGDRPERAPRE